MVYLRKFVSGMTGKQPGGPSVLRTDNKAARDLSYNPEMHNRTGRATVGSLPTTLQQEPPPRRAGGRQASPGAMSSSMKTKTKRVRRYLLSDSVGTCASMCRRVTVMARVWRADRVPRPCPPRARAPAPSGLRPRRCPRRVRRRVGRRGAARAPLGEVAGVRDAHLFALAHPRDGGWCISCCQEQKRTRANAKCPGVEFDLAVLFFMLHCVLFCATLQLH